MVFYLKFPEEPFPLLILERWVACLAEQKEATDKFRVQNSDYSQERKYHDKSR
jgi:hypothetical protein